MKNEHSSRSMYIYCCSADDMMMIFDASECMQGKKERGYYIVC